MKRIGILFCRGEFLRLRKHIGYHIRFLFKSIDSNSLQSNISVLPVKGAIILIIISALLTVIAGIIPSRMAAKKDPVESLRVE